MSAPKDQRWTVVSPSQFTHEDEGLEIVRNLLPDQAPYRAWSNFEFRDGRGRWHEVDLLVLGRRRLHLVELKYYSGTLHGDDHTWRRDGHRAEDSPLKLARRKAQYFASKLQDEYERWVRERNVPDAPRAREVVPFVQESVFLHHPRFVSELSEASARGLYGIDGLEHHSNLPGISELLLEPGNDTVRDAVLSQLMKRIGLVQRREREAGSWVIQDGAIAEGEGWQEWEAYHRVVQQRSARIRFQVVPQDAPESERRRVLSIAEHEFRVMSHLNHEGVLRPDDIIDDDLGVGMVYPLSDDWQRLDLWLADHGDQVSIETRLSIIRQVGEALQYAHGNRVVHRGINPSVIWVRPSDGGELRVQVRDWQTAGSVAAEQHSSATPTGVTALIGADSRAGGTGWLEAFAAPEGSLARGVDRVRVDVFGLGAVAFYLLAGAAAADSVVALTTRLREQNGLDLSADVPEVSTELRTAILNATRPAVSERTSDIASFLDQLAAAEAPPAEDERSIDPLDASPGALLGDRFRLVRRLGRGSTADGLLVRDEFREDKPEHVLKVAINDRAAARLHDEAEVLRAVSSPRVVELIEGPLKVDGREALLLATAGDHTLAQEMSQRPRVSLDLLERWGTDLLRALIELDTAGIDHRDIKPANLGVREGRSDRAKHLVLFDFSLSRAAADAVKAGTPPYLDPFLGTDGRILYDSAAEMYSAAVVLFEMATGQPPVYGDGLSDPSAITDAATVVPAQFDPSTAEPMTAFFRRALARRAADRYDTARDLFAAWQQIFERTTTGAPDNAAELQEQATPETPLTQAGLSARAISALEPFALTTVGDLVAVDAARLSRPLGVKDLTRKEIRAAARVWRSKFGSAIRTRRAATPLRTTVLPDPLTIADRLLAVVRKDSRTSSRADFAARLLGVTPGVDAFASQGQIGASLSKPVTAARVNQMAAELQDAWAAEDDTRDLLDRIGEQALAHLKDLGGIATVGELVDHLITVMVENVDADDNHEVRVTAGLLHVVTDRLRARMRGGDTEVTELQLRRHSGRPLVIGTNSDLLDSTDELARAADRLVAAVNPGDQTDGIVPAARVASSLLEATRAAEATDSPLEPGRLARLAAVLSTRAAASATHELHHRGLPAHRALALALKAVAPGQKLPPAEIRDRVRARFPSLASLPERPRLDQIVADSGLDLIYDDVARAYRPPESIHDTTGLESRAPTSLATAAPALSADGVVGQRLADSIARRSFLALAAPGSQLDRLARVLQERHSVQVVNLTSELLGAMHAQADSVGLPWDQVLAADADAPGSRAARGLQSLVERAMPTVTAAIESALTTDATSPVVLTDVGALARYGAMATLSRWTDLTTSRPRPLWLVVPQLLADRGSIVEGKPLPLAAPSQFVVVDRAWIDSQLSAPPAEGTPA